ncbi:MAG: hypothetical protein AB2803_20020 [Candidatus Thiodiazotropha sp.]
MSTPFDEIGKKLRERRKQLLQANLMGAAETTPDQHARVIDLSERSGIPQQLIEPNLKQYQSEDKWRRVNYQRIIKNSPGLAKWLEDQSNAKLASDDLDSLEVAEKGIVGLADAVRSVPAGAVDQGLGKAFQGAGSIYNTTGESLSEFVPYRDEINEALKPLAPYVDIGGGLRALGQYLSGVGDVLRPPEERRGFHTEVGEALGQLATQIGLTVANPVAGTASFGLVGYEAGLQEAIEAGASENEQVAAATLTGLATLVSEKTGIDLLLKRVPPNIRNKSIRYLVDTAMAGGIEAIEEKVEGILQDLIRKGVYDPDHEVDYGFGREEGVAFTAAGIARALLHGLAKGRSLQTSEERAAEQVERFKEVRDQIAETETFKRHKESFRTFAQSALESKDSKVYIDAETAVQYFQSAGEDPDTHFQQLGVSAQVNDAVQLGGDLVVNLEDFMTTFADSEHFDGLVIEARLNKEDLSYRQAAEQSQQYSENLEQEAEQVLEQYSEDLTFQQSADAVQEQIREQLVSVGTDPQVADRYAALHRANAIVLANEMGKAPAEIAEMFPLQIGTQAAMGDVVLNQGDEPDLSVQGIMDQFKNDIGGEISVSEADDIVTLNKIIVPKESRKTGIGTEYIQRLQTYAQQNGKTLALSPSADFGGTSVGRLKKFYKSLGFVENKGKNRDFSISESMYWAPQESSEQLDDEKTFFQSDPVDGHKNYTSKVLKSWRSSLKRATAKKQDYKHRLPVSPVLRSVGVDSEILEISNRVLFQVARKHGDIPKSVIDNLPILLLNPEFAYPYKDGGINVAIDAASESGSPIVVGIRDGRVRTITPQDDMAETNGRERILKGVVGGIDRGQTVYARNEKALNELRALDPQAERTIPAGSNGLGRPQAGGDNYQGIAGREGNIVDLAQVVKNHGSPYYQQDAVNSKYWQKKIGVTTFTGDITKSTTIISLLDGADLSTFLHESGHFFLQQRIHLINTGQATEKMAQDMQALLEWFGVESVDQIKNDQHEQFAQGFEVYLREGRAPSTELQSVFDRFAAWLSRVYKTLRELDVNLTDEVRGVMDRMLATQEAIDEAEQAARLLPVFETAEEAQMTAAEFEAYNDAAVRATYAAKRDLLQKAQEDEQRKRTRAYRDAWREMQAEVEEDLSQNPVYQAKEFLMHGKALGNRELNVEPMKLSKQILIDIYGDEADAPWRRLPVGRHSVTAKDGVHPDVVASLFGFDSGQELVEALVEAGSFKAAVKAETQRRMDVAHGTLENPAKLAEAAIDQVHSKDERLSFLEQELIALEKRAGIEKTPREVLKMAARRIIAGKRARDIREGDYMRNHIKAARATQEAIIAGDYRNAANEKRKQILNLYAWREAKEARKKIDSAQKYFTKFSKPGTRKNLARDYLDQIDNLLEAYDFKKSVSNVEIDKRKALSAWVQEQSEAGYEVGIPADLLEKAGRRHYRDLQYEDLMALRDYVSNIEHLARLKQRLIVDGKNRQFDDVVSELVVKAGESFTIINKPDDYSEGEFSKFKEWGNEFFAAHTKAEFLFNQLDGNEHGGPFWRYLFKQLADAETAEQERVEQAVEALNKIFDRFDAKERSNWYSNKMFIRELGITGNKSTILSIALNWGNLDNRDRILNGHGWSEAQVNAVLMNDKYMGKREWEMVQAVWDHIDSYWSDISKLQNEISGLVPDKVRPTQVLTPWGTFKGGYYPIKYDTKRSFLALRRAEEQDIKDLYGGNAIRPATRQGHTKERTGGGGQKVRLELGVIHEHIHQVIHDLTHRQAIHQVDRLINNDDVRQVIKGAAGNEAYNLLRPWLANIAADQNVTNNSIERVIGRFRHGATIVNMGWKLSTAIVQPLGYLQSLELLGEKWSMIGLRRFYSNPLKNKDLVFDKSIMMRNRAKTFDRDVRDAVNKIKGTSLKDKLEKTFFSHIGFFDLSVSLPTWLGAYEKSLAEGKNESDAIAFADSMVRMSQSAGGAKDLATVQSGPELHRMFTMFYSYFSVLYNLIRRRVKISKSEGWASTPRAAMSFLYLIVLPSVLSELIAGRGPEDDEDEAIWAMKTVAGYPAATIVLGRDIANGVLSPYGYDLSPIGNAIGSLGNASKSVADIVMGDGDETDLKNLTMATGYVFGLPARQLWTVGDNLEAMMSGEDVNLFEALMIKEVKD